VEGKKSRGQLKNEGREGKAGPSLHGKKPRPRRDQKKKKQKKKISGPTPQKAALYSGNLKKGLHYLPRSKIRGKNLREGRWRVSPTRQQGRCLHPKNRGGKPYSLEGKGKRIRASQGVERPGELFSTGARIREKLEKEKVDKRRFIETETFCCPELPSVRDAGVKNGGTEGKKKNRQVAGQKN